MKAMSEQESEVQEILERGGTWTTKEIAEETNLQAEKVREVIKKLRRKFFDGHNEVTQYVFTTKGGYSMDEKPENVMYEARLRMALGTGVLFNGAYVFKTGKKIALANYRKMKIEYKPKLLQIEQF